MLFSIFRFDTIVYEDLTFTSELVNNKHKCISKQSQSFTGYCLNQASKYGIKGSRYGDLLQVQDYLRDFTSEQLDQPVENFKDSIPKLTYVTLITKHDLEYIQVLSKMHQTTITMYEFKARIKREVDQYGERVKLATKGVDWKALSHAYRVIHEFAELSATNHIIFPLAAAEQIKRIKYCTDEGKLDNILITIRELLDMIEENLQHSKLPDQVDREFLNTLVLKLYGENNET